MPCYQIQTCNVELNNANHDLLAKALEKDGYKVVKENGKIKSFSKGQVSGTYQNNKLAFTGTSKIDSDQIKRGYSEQVIERKKKQFASQGWSCEKTKEGEYVFRKAKVSV